MSLDHLLCIDGSVLIGYSNRPLCKITGEDLVKEDATVPRVARVKSSDLYNTFTTSVGRSGRRDPSQTYRLASSTI